MTILDQNCTPLASALKKEVERENVPFDVPGHKGSGEELERFFGKEILRLDLNSRIPLDFLCESKGVIYQAERLAAEAFGAKDVFFMVAGTTASVQTIIMSACAPGDKILLPRNVHYSVINAVILAGAEPIYMNPSVHRELGISLGVSLEEVKKTIKNNPDAKALFLNNPTYYGICSDLKRITETAHQAGLKVLVDEAHGTHFYFSDELPASAMACGADLSAVSMHKTGGALTQSSMVLSSGSISPDHIRRIMGLTLTTSASYLLLASLDLARKNLAINGSSLLKRVVNLSRETREEINRIGGYWAFGKDIVDGDAIFDYDETKLSVHTLGVGLAGVEVYDLLRGEYKIQAEFGDMDNILAMATIGDKAEYHITFIRAMKSIKEKYSQKKKMDFEYEYITPCVVIPPRDAFYSSKITMPLIESEGRISGTSVMCYPPGIPILAPGERVTREIISHILHASEKGCSITGLTKEGELVVIK